MYLNLPPSLCEFRADLKEFFIGMTMKLDLNSHKDTPNRTQINTMIDLLLGELEEFKQQLSEDKFNNNSLLELCDTANYAFLMFYALRQDGVKTRREEIIDEYLLVDEVLGKVYCKKSRAGSQYKPGQEIRGSNRNGYVDIKLQSALGNTRGITVPRSHLVWRKAHGTWPNKVLDHINGIKNDDSIHNLREATFRENALNKHTANRKYPPHVSKYEPTGRQHLSNYGKYVYQRHYNGANVRIAYFDTPEEASEQGYKSWLVKTGQINSVRNIEDTF